MDDVYAIRLRKTELREAYEVGSVNRVLSVFADQYSDMSVGLASFYGAEAKAVLRHRVSNLFARYHARLAVTIISIRVQGALAFDWGWHKLTLTPKGNGRSITKRTRYLEVWQKEANGNWKIAIFLDNVDVPPQMPPKEVLSKMVATARPVGQRPTPARRTRPSNPSVKLCPSCFLPFHPQMA